MLNFRNFEFTKLQILNFLCLQVLIEVLNAGPCLHEVLALACSMAAQGSAPGPVCAAASGSGSLACMSQYGYDCTSSNSAVVMAVKMLPSQN